MRLGAKTFAVLAAGSVLCTFAAAQETAAQLLARSMQRQFAVNIVAIILQKDPESDGFQRVKVERNKQGLARCTILQPLRLSGITSVDTGERLLTFLPDQRVVVDQRSPGADLCEVDDKIALAKRNYTFKIVPSGKIAGRDTICVQASPKFDDLETRRYFLDAKTAYPLRLETFIDQQELNVVFDTKDINFPKSIDNKTFELDAGSDVYVQKYTKPKTLVSGAQASKSVGFVPLIPEGLPLGFKSQEIQFSEQGRWKSIVIRLSDGLARATLYQWPANQKVTVQAFSNSSSMVHNGIRLMLVSDLSPSVRMQLLKAFISQASIDPSLRPQRILRALMPVDAGLQASLELISSVWAFSGIENLSDFDTSEGVRVPLALSPKP
jgi:outer membrane lipoprotein-sorting protein